MEKYNYLHECELEAALIESRRDIKNGKYIKESVQDHIKRLKQVWKKDEQICLS